MAGLGLAALALPFSIYAGRHAAERRFEDLGQRMLRLNREIRSRADLPGISAEETVGRDSKNISFFHSSLGYREWLRAQAGLLGVQEGKLHESVLETMRNLQVYTRRHAKEDGKKFPVVIFTESERMAEHPMLLSELIANARKSGDVFVPLENHYRGHTFFERVYLRPGFLVRYFPRLYRFPNLGTTFGVVTCFDTKIVTEELGELLAKRKKPEKLVWLVPHETLHAFNFDMPHETVWDRGYKIGDKIKGDPALFARIFAPLLKLRDAYLSRQAINAARKIQTSLPRSDPRTIRKNLPRIVPKGPTKRQRR